MKRDWDSPKMSKWLADLRLAAVFLTRLPIRPARERAGPLGEAAWAFAAIGIGVGLAGGIVFAIAIWLGLPATPAAVLAVGCQVMLTGALHEDGLADTADGFGGGKDPEAKLRIMRDSRSGAFGVVAVVLSLAGRVAAIASLEPALVAAALVATGALSRAGTVWLMALMPPARADGLGASAGRPGLEHAWAATGIGALAGLLLLGFGPAVAMLVVGGIALALFAQLAKRQVGGQTGDVLGASQQVGELACLFALAAVLT